MSLFSADASAYGLGAVLLQKIDSHWKSVAYASCAMSETECHYVQIEKEALAAIWACEKFSDFVLGKHIVLETGHKPLVLLLRIKDLNQLLPRILRFCLRLDRFSFDIIHIPGKELYTAGTLSDNITELQELAELCVAHVISHLPAGSQRLESYRRAQSEDPLCQQLIEYCNGGWPDLEDLNLLVRCCWEFCSELTFCDGLLM